MRVPRFVILEDHALVREALSSRLVSQFGDIEVVYQGTSLFDAKSAIETKGADCVLLDLDLADRRRPETNILAMVKTQVPVLIVSAMGSPAVLRFAFEVGVCGFLSKSAPSEEFSVAVRAALRGESYTSSEAAAAILAASSSTASQLSDQERRAMMLYASGLKMRVVASTMGVGEGTAREYIKRVRAKYAKAGTPVPTKTELYRRAVEDGLLG